MDCFSPGEPKVLLACSGLGHVQRGFESATAEMAEAFTGAVDLTVARGGGPWSLGDDVRLPCLQRRGRIATRLGLGEAAAYVWEQRSFSLSLYALARGGRFDVVHLHDGAVANAMWHARRRFGGQFAILFTNSGPFGPEHLWRPDLVQSVSPVGAEELEAVQFPEYRHATVPFGIRPIEVNERRFETGAQRRLVSVGALNDRHKGLATIIRAVASLPDVRLRLLGQPDEETPGLIDLARTLLGDRATLETVPREQIPTELAAADIFVLPTHGEGFCLAVLEALEAGIPCVVSDIPILRWLTGGAAVLVPPGRPELWAAALAALGPAQLRELSERGRERARAFHWSSLVDSYRSMYQQAVRAARTVTAAG
jgi:1,2-diacylglycerol 3-alpha-glucosyltransferase